MKYTNLFLLVILFLTACAKPTTSAPAPTETFTPAPTATQTLVPTPTLTPAPTQVGGGSGRFVFTYRKDEFVNLFPDLKGETNIFVADIDGDNLTPVTDGLDGIIYLMDISPDGKKLLATSTSNIQNKESNLYMIDLDLPESEPIMLAEGLPNYYGNNSSAKWINDSEIAYIGQGEAGFGIYIISLDGTNSKSIYSNTSGEKLGNPFEILKIVDSKIYWDSQDTTRLTSNSVNNKYYISWTSIDGSETRKLEENGEQIFFENVFAPDLLFSPDGTKIAWVSGATGPEDPYPFLNIASVSDINNPQKIQTLTGILILKWFPDNSKILVFDLGSVNRSIEEYSEFYKTNPDKPLASSFESLYGIYEVQISSTLQVRNYNIAPDVIGSLNSNAFIDLYDISPDSRQIILSTYTKNEKGSYDTELKFLDLDALNFSDVNGFYFMNTATDGIRWIP